MHFKEQAEVKFITIDSRRLRDRIEESTADDLGLKLGESIALPQKLDDMLGTIG